jgi:membrane-associated phospholipid phosphatase
MRSMGRCAAVCLCVALAAPIAHAEDRDGSPDVSYLYDGGAIPFIWLALGTRLVLDANTQPRDSPLLFSAREGGAPPPEWSVPGWTVTATGGVLAGAMVLGGDRSRWYHVKGLAQTLSTGVAITAGLKVTFGRHRPDYDPAADAMDDHRSFPSGHSTQAFAIATYAAAYLHTHVFDDPWGPGAVASYAALYGAATAVAAERVVHNQHHLSDVAAGALLGSATSVAFFIYQEHRFRNRSERSETGPVITPLIENSSYGLQLGLQW